MICKECEVCNNYKVCENGCFGNTKPCEHLSTDTRFDFTDFSDAASACREVSE